MTNFTKLRRWYAMLAERMSGPLVCGLCLVWVALMASQARADDCRMTLSEPRVDYGVIRPRKRQPEGMPCDSIRSVRCT